MGSTLRARCGELKIRAQGGEAQLRVDAVAGGHGAAAIHVGGHQPAQQGGGQIVGMPLDIVADAQQLQLGIGAAVEGVGGGGAGGDQRGGGAQTAADGDAGFYRDGKARHGQTQRVHDAAVGHNGQVFLVAELLLAAGKLQAGGGFCKGEGVIKLQRAAEGVKAGADIGGGGGNADGYHCFSPAFPKT